MAYALNVRTLAYTLRCVRTQVSLLRVGQACKSTAAEPAGAVSVVGGEGETGSLHTSNTSTNPSATTDLIVRIAQRLDKKADKLYEGRPVFTDLDFVHGSLTEANEIADFTQTAHQCYSMTSIMTIQGKPIEILYTNEAASANRWVRDHVHDKKATVIGLDTEQRPSFWAKPKRPLSPHKKGASAMAINAAAAGACAVLQLATKNAVLVLHLAHLSFDESVQDVKYETECDIRHPVGFFATGAPRNLLALLSDPAMRFVGVNVASDLNVVCRHLRLGPHDHSSAVVDVDKFARALGIRRAGPGMCHGLESLAHKILGVPRWKTGALSLSNWSSVPLSQRQVRYAALDAWAGWALHDYLVNNIRERSTTEIQLVESGLRYLWLHDVAMLPPGKALSISWLKKRNVQIEEYGSSVLSKSPFPRARNGRLLLPTLESCQQQGITPPLLVPTFRSRSTAAVNGSVFSDAPGSVVPLAQEEDSSGTTESASEPGDSNCAEGEFWHADRLHPGVKVTLENLDI